MRTFLLVTTFALVAASIFVWSIQPPATENGKIVLTWVSDDNPARTVQAKAFEKLHPDIKINIDPANGGVEKVVVQSLAGVGPDVFDAFDVFQLAAYVKSGVALDVTDELKQHGIDLQAQAFPGALATSVYEGRTYGIPNNVAVDGLWFHKDILREAGVKLPGGAWTWQQFIPIAQALTKRRADGQVERYGLLFEWWNWRHFFNGFGARVFTPDGTRCIVDSPQAIDAVQMMYDLVYKYQVSPTPVEETSMAAQGGFGSGYITLFGAKRAAMAIGGRWWLAQLRDAKGLELGVHESPYGSVRAFHSYGRGMLVNNNSKHLQAALEFQRFLASDTYLDLINDQADSVAAFKKADEKSSFLFNPKFPNEKDNAEWLRITDLGIPDETSPYVDSSTVTRLIQAQMDLVQAGQKSPREAMQTAAANIKDAIAKSLSEDPTLAEQYRKATSGAKP